MRIKAGALLVRTKPSVTGTHKAGRKLTGKTGKWTPTPTLTRQWLRDGQPIAGASGATYRLTAGDRGHRVQLQVTAMRNGCTTKVALTSATRIR